MLREPKMEKTKIEWTDSSWNPITGCYNDCPYCYARRIAHRMEGCDNAPEEIKQREIIYLRRRLTYTDKRGKTRAASYPFGFKPTFHEYRLFHPKKGSYGKTIFVCSMADMFGPWIPDEWIAKVFDECQEAPEHRYLFLTKYPERYIKLADAGHLPQGDMYWYGSTATGPSKPVFYADEYNTFVSVEPILEPFRGSISDIGHKVDWAIFGAETGNRKDKVVPERWWIEDAVALFKEAGKPVFMKDSMIPIWGEDILTEMPWED